MSQRATGSFEVKVGQQPLANPDAGARLGRFTLEKHYLGELVATGIGEMLTAGSPGDGSAGYVAIEQVDGTLHGKRGGFALQHLGWMKPSGMTMNVYVVPGSGSAELAGIEGRLTITIVDGRHDYALDYTLPN